MVSIWLFKVSNYKQKIYWFLKYLLYFTKYIKEARIPYYSVNNSALARTPFNDQQNTSESF